ncbi:VOC family protein [Chryseobacterium soli]|uniref:VOC family protein n=1 Tax=Chryseobacterium soli TaxID=445961 RepID=UPI0029549E16|nr:VOC family protein [Chryseobacterium soli]MDV7698825.1 VOC family protein [Chryseobacterium soli]
MQNRILGLHHITAIADNAKRNFDFYTQVLGLRLVKKTVNFDDPEPTISTLEMNMELRERSLLSFHGKESGRERMEADWLLISAIQFRKEA